MQYEPIKRSLGKFFSGPLFMRKLLYFLLDLLLLRAWHVKKTLRKIRKELPDQASVLDAGSGFGQYTWRMCRMNNNWKISAVDINSEEIQECSQFFMKSGLSGNVTFSTADLTTFIKPESYDLILSVDVMEHIREDEIVFQNFYKSLKNNGIVLISTPSDKGGSDVHSDEDVSFIHEHVRNGYGIREITEKMTAAGFSPVHVSYTYGKPGSISWKLSMKYPVKMINKSSLFFIFLPFYYIICFPVSTVLNIFDIWITHKTGSGLLVTARKQV